MRDIIRKILNKYDYEIIKQPYRGDKYPNLSKNLTEYYCETPIGNFYLPYDAEKGPRDKYDCKREIFEENNIHLAKKYIKEGTAVLDIGQTLVRWQLSFQRQ